MNAEQISDVLFRITDVAVKDRNYVIIVIPLQRWIPTDINGLCLFAINQNTAWKYAYLNQDNSPTWLIGFTTIVQPDWLDLLLWSSLLLSSLLDDWDVDEELESESLWETWRIRSLAFLVVLLVVTSDAELDDFPLWTVRYTITPAATTKTQATIIRQTFLTLLILILSFLFCLFIQLFTNLLHLRLVVF